jgi:hypothetical protein
MKYSDYLKKSKNKADAVFKQRFLDALYFLGMVMISTSSINQIYKTATTHNVTSFAIAWLIMLTVGEAFHIPRSLSSTFWVWKLNCFASLFLMTVLLILVIYYKYFGG